MLRNWRAWVLLTLLVGPVLAYIGFGTLWLYQRGWLLVVGSLWVASGVVFSLLAARWTKSQRPVLPPIDWDAPATFTQTDRDAWAIVEEEAEKGEAQSLEKLTEFDVYIDTGKHLARKLAAHYHPLSDAPIDHVPVVDLLTALELAAEDLSHLSRQVPGGDMVTPAHWRKAVQVAGYFQRANDIYSYLLPIFSPVTGLARLGAQQWMVKPAWRNMQQNLLHWFFRAYVNRLGVHLIELYSGRLAIGAQQYRKLTRKAPRTPQGADGDLPPLRIVVAGARDAGKSRLITLVGEAASRDLSVLSARLGAAGIDESTLDRLKSAEWVEAPGYTVTPGGESARDRSTRRDAVEGSVEADVLVLVCDARRDSTAADSAFAQAWDRWYIEHPDVELPPALAVLTALDDPGLGGDWKPPYDWSKGEGTRETAARARVTALRTSLPPSLTEIVPVGLPESSPFGVIEHLLPSLILLMNRAERSALIRHLRNVSRQSKARRLASQVGAHGKTLWNSIRSGRRASADASPRR